MDSTLGWHSGAEPDVRNGSVPECWNGWLDKVRGVVRCGVAWCGVAVVLVVVLLVLGVVMVVRGGVAAVIAMTTLEVAVMATRGRVDGDAAGTPADPAPTRAATRAATASTASAPLWPTPGGSIAVATVASGQGSATTPAVRGRARQLLRSGWWA